MEKEPIGAMVQLELFNDELDEAAISAILKLKRQARVYRQTARQLEMLVEELEDSLNAKYR